MPTNKEKEKRKVRYEDLTPSLQARIGNLTTKDKLADLQAAIDRLTATAKSIRITEAFSKPTDPVNDMELHFDQNYPLPQTYHGDKWEAITMVPDGIGNGQLTNTLTIIQSAHQTITVTIDGKQHTSTVTGLKYGTTYSCTIASEAGWAAGTINIYTGVIYGDSVVYATPAVESN